MEGHLRDFDEVQEASQQVTEELENATAARQTLSLEQTTQVVEALSCSLEHMNTAYNLLLSKLGHVHQQSEHTDDLRGGGGGHRALEVCSDVARPTGGADDASELPEHASGVSAPSGFSLLFPSS